jgi:hypothetical protein
MVAPVGPAGARVLLTRDEALRQVFGAGSTVTARTAYLTDAQVDSVRRRAQAPFTQRRVTYYVIRSDAGVETAFIDQGIVRSQTQTVLIALDPGGRVRAVEVLAWNEPDDFRPSARWLGKASGLSEISAIRPGEAMPHLAGATLSARAITAAVRRAIVLRQVLGLGPARSQ